MKKIKYNSGSNRTRHWNEGYTTRGVGVSPKKLSYEKRAESLKEYLKEQAKYILAKPSSARIT